MGHTHSHKNEALTTPSWALAVAKVEIAVWMESKGKKLIIIRVRGNVELDFML